MISFSFLCLIIAFALIFDFLNGFHDAGNSIATVVSTRILSPQAAVIWASFFNVMALFLFGSGVATTMGKGIINPSILDASIIFSALTGAIIWNLFTWYYGIPSSSSHALVGGLAGAAVAKAGVHSLVWGGIGKILLSIILSPLIGVVLAATCMTLVNILCQGFRARKVDLWFRRLQLFSAAFYSLGHGANDAQKTMGVIAALLFSQGYLGDEFHVPSWVIISCYTVMGLGTLMGGWRIVKTMGMKITRLKPVGGFCAEIAGSITLMGATHLGIPISTTHTITGSIIGVGTVTKFSGIRWQVAQKIVVAWFLTIPCSAFMSLIVLVLTQFFFR